MMAHSIINKFCIRKIYHIRSIFKPARISFRYSSNIKDIIQVSAKDFTPSNLKLRSLISYNEKQLNQHDILDSILRSIQIMDFKRVDEKLQEYLKEESKLTIHDFNALLAYEHILPLRTLNMIFNYINASEIQMNTISYHYLIRSLLNNKGFISAYRVMLSAVKTEILVDFSILSILYKEALMIENQINKKKFIFSIYNVSLYFFGKEQTQRLKSLDKIIEEYKIENLIEENVDNEDFDLAALSSKEINPSKILKSKMKSEAKISYCVCKCYPKLLKSRSMRI